MFKQTKRLQSVIRDRDIQFKHELKKKERETNKLKERQEEMYQVLIGNYEEKQRELMLENTDLRDCLMHMQKELISVMNRPESSHSANTLPVTNNSINSSNSIASDDEDSSSSQLTLDEISDGPSNGARTSPSRNLASKSDEELDKLKKQLKKYKEIIKQQEDLIQRKVFEEERATVLKNQFLQLSPFGKGTPVKQETPQKGEKQRLLPSTPMFSPAPSEPPKTPSTQELYRILGLTPKDIQRREKSTPAIERINQNEVKRVPSSESLLSGSCFSDPCDTKQGKSLSERTMSSTKQNSGSRDILNNYIEARRTLFRRSSTGSNEGLNV
ncbi:hypothetical protein KUTeg_016609 [Tegillarca granosa]|uniref:Uncharacterized protein n=1 Tax=Tegillarca granosa TaxID=220873 RepID=A0ABQ9ELB2_TEGGR|nr:hypothetical protein KUTeg_016609 [Tegillarca granosa]